MKSRKVVGGLESGDGAVELTSCGRSPGVFARAAPAHSTKIPSRGVTLSIASLFPEHVSLVTILPT